MPRVRRKLKHRRTGYTDAHIRQLLTGYDYLRTAFGRDTVNSRCDHDAMRRAWDDLREEMLSDWIHERPGTPPYAWWKFDAPEERRRVDGVHPFDNPRRTAYVDNQGPCHPLADPYRLSYGKLAVLVPYDPPVHDDFNAEYESQCAYLDRLGLLVEGERVGRDPRSTMRTSHVKHR